MMIVNFICTSRTGDDRTASADLVKFVPGNVTVRGDVAATRFAIRDAEHRHPAWLRAKQRRARLPFGRGIGATVTHTLERSSRWRSDC
jgi:hypothetical protein